MAKANYKNLILVGNGFDCWQSIPTSYEEFRVYYHQHVKEAARALGYPLYSAPDGAGGEKEVTAVELIYGNPFEPGPLEDAFFWNLEARMDKLDDVTINLFFGRSEEGIQKLNQAVEQATTLLRKLFCDWVGTLDIQEQNSGFVFPEDCFVVNFNYTDTLEKRFGVKPQNDFHIHGVASDPGSIVVGHSTHPETAFREMQEQRLIRSMDPSKGLPRIKGMYAVENALYHTDKHTADRIDQLCIALLKNGVHIEDIENIYVLGHSFAPADMDYFRFIDGVTRRFCDYEKLSAAGHLDRNLLASIMEDPERLYDLIWKNLQYVIHRLYRTFPGVEDPFAYLDETVTDAVPYPYDEKGAKHAVEQRFWMEQAGRTQALLEGLAKEYGVPVPEGCHSILGYMDHLDHGRHKRQNHAVWHISYYTDQDKARITAALRKLHIKQKRYTLHSTIDACIADFAL